jgi:predicted dehydrogenase
VGIGFGQNVLVPAFRSDDRVTVTALCASSLERAKVVATRLGVQRWFGAWHELVESPEVDAVAIAVPPVLQPQVAAAAIAQGKHIFCEKPVALDVKRARSLLEQAAAAGVAAAVDFEFQELGAWKRAKALVDSGALGTLRGFALGWHVETRANRLQVDSWKQRSDLGGGALAGFASHSFHLIEWLMGQVGQVSARLSPSDTVDTRVTALLELRGGLAGTISIATDAVAGSGHRLEINGSEGSLLLENSSGDHLRNFVLTHTSRSGTVTLLDERDPARGQVADGRIAPVAQLVRRFVDAALGGGPVQPGLTEGLRVEQLMDAVRASSRSGAWVQV